MSRRINVRNPLGYNISRDRLRQASAAVLTLHPQRLEQSLTITVTDAAALQSLNQQHRRLDAPTDVLAFAAAPLPAAIAQEPPYLGDILIAHDYVAESTAGTGADLDDTLCLLVIHGSLHLLGYTHNDSSNKQAMWAQQAAALESIDIDPVIVSEYADAIAN